MIIIKHFTNESNFDIELPISDWYAIKKINKPYQISLWNFTNKGYTTELNHCFPFTQYLQLIWKNIHLQY